MKTYQIVEVAGKNNDAGTKAVQDAAVIAKKNGFTPVYVKMCTTKEGALAKAERQLGFWYDWRAAYRAIEPDSIVLLQNPFHYKQLTREKVLRKLKEVKKVKFISLVHDVEELRRFRYDDYYKSEFESMLALVDVLIVHNDRMAEFFRQRGVPEEKLVLLHIFDYLQDHEPAAAPAFEKKITVAGNLDTKKCAYIKELSRLHDVEVQLYGSNFDPAMKDCAHIHYGGSFPPDEIPSKLTGGFGLVWDGTSIDGCQGDAGQYLRYNNPHKLSLYLSSGLPVVIWSGAAEADLVKKYNVGITVDSLLKLPDQMAQLTEGDYNTMRNNTKTLAQKLKHGYYAEQALKKALCIIKKNETI